LHVSLVDWLAKQRRDDIPPIIRYGKGFFAFLVLVAGVTDFFSPLLATVLEPSP